MFMLLFLKVSALEQKKQKSLFPLWLKKPEHSPFHFSLHPSADIRPGCAIPTTHTDNTEHTLTHTSFMHKAPPNTHIQYSLIYLMLTEIDHWCEDQVGFEQSEEICIFVFKKCLTFVITKTFLQFITYFLLLQTAKKSNTSSTTKSTVRMDSIQPFLTTSQNHFSFQQQI